MIDWNEISAIATACAASFTAWMALLTRKAINQSRYALHQGKEQHMDNFRPVCVLEAYSDEHMDVTKRNQIVMVSRCDDNYHCVIKAHLINVGSGPATDILLKIYFLPSSENPLIKNLGIVLAAGNKIDEVSILFSRDIHKELNLSLTTLPEKSGGQAAARESWNIILTYKDIFGRTFETHHTSCATQPWTVLSPAGGF